MSTQCRSNRLSSGSRTSIDVSSVRASAVVTRTSRTSRLMIAQVTRFASCAVSASLDHRGEIGHPTHQGAWIEGGDGPGDPNELVVGQLRNEADRGIAQERVESLRLRLRHGESFGPGVQLLKRQPSTYLTLGSCPERKPAARLGSLSRVRARPSDRLPSCSCPAPWPGTSRSRPRGAGSRRLRRCPGGS